ncbi:MAG TPA: 50S ribosomal protein L19 [Candidatus Xenobia bacterium]|jgi:large subunit ribosomal protein L19
MDLIHAVEREQMTRQAPDFRPGDTVRVSIKIEADTEDKKKKEGKGVQAFEGICIDRKRKGLNESFTLRKISNGVGVERSFLLHSPRITKIEVVRRGDVSKARLYYLRDKVGKQARVREKRVNTPGT